MSKKNHLKSSPKKKKRNTYTPYYSEEFRDVVKFIQNKLKKNVYLIGIRAMYERGVPAYRLTEDFDIHTPLTKEERDEIIDYVRDHYKKAKHVWRKFGFGLDFYPIGRLHHMDVNIISPLIFDSSWEEEEVEINGVNIFLPPLEDLIILKVLSPRKKDQKDVGVALRLALKKINIDLLLRKAEKVRVEAKLKRLAKKYQVDI
ncbi:MAG: hypothetical protein HWN65_18040 [Candidatus Helarchaeota archaeon]|nr:hypothetical protein [Candidatus Helarchaeota archaeon]